MPDYCFLHEINKVKIQLSRNVRRTKYIKISKLNWERYVDEKAFHCVFNWVFGFNKSSRYSIFLDHFDRFLVVILFFLVSFSQFSSHNKISSWKSIILRFSNVQNASFEQSNWFHVEGMKFGWLSKTLVRAECILQFALLHLIPVHGWNYGVLLH